MIPNWAAGAVLCTALAILPAAGFADSPAATGKKTRISVNTVTVLAVTADIQTVVVANPEFADASLASPRKVLLLGKKPGHTSLLVTGRDGQVLIDTSVLVAPDDTGMVTVIRGIKESNMTCSPRCTQLLVPKESGTAAAAGGRSGESTVSGGADGAPTEAAPGSANPETSNNPAGFSGGELTAPLDQ
jgi:Flp pilus assembly secretin CpaC